MFSFSTRRARVTLALLGVFLGGLLGGVAVAGHGDGHTFYACLSSGGILGNVSVDVEEECRGNTTPVSWGSQGPPGPAGGVLGFYVVEDGVEAAPFPDPWVIGLVEDTPATLVATCSPGDAAMSGAVVVTRESTLDEGATTTITRFGGDLGPIPIIDTGTVTGYELRAGARMTTHPFLQDSRTSYLLQVTCADMTP